MRSSAIAISLGFVLGACATPTAAQSDQSAISAVDFSDGGYTYPAPAFTETVSTIVGQVQPGPPELRVQITSVMMAMEAQRPHPPTFFPVIEGDRNEVLVIMSVGVMNIDTPYKARAFASILSSLMRNNPLFVEYGVENYASVFDMLKIWGIERLVVTNGDEFAHEFVIE
ncbi:MAG: hypothetical protein AAF829_01520 [Pseudomonadota bacterium]